MKKCLKYSLFFTISFLFLQYSAYAKDKCISGNCINGNGTMIYSNGIKYVGEFKNGEPNGKGTSIYSNGNKYIGEFKNGRKNGQGTYIYKNGPTKKGMWQNGSLVEKKSDVNQTQTSKSNLRLSDVENIYDINKDGYVNGRDWNRMSTKIKAIYVTSYAVSLFQEINGRSPSQEEIEDEVVNTVNNLDFYYLGRNYSVSISDAIYNVSR
jgi:hypothetical protein